MGKIESKCYKDRYLLYRCLQSRKCMGVDWHELYTIMSPSYTAVRWRR